jgi:hypothetical protein
MVSRKLYDPRTEWLLLMGRARSAAATRKRKPRIQGHKAYGRWFYSIRVGGK